VALLAQRLGFPDQRSSTGSSQYDTKFSIRKVVRRDSMYLPPSLKPRHGCRKSDSPSETRLRTDHRTGMWSRAPALVPCAWDGMLPWAVSAVMGPRG
jgi:hypothetical protein